MPPHKFHPTILREYDIRGIVDDTLTLDDARALGMAFGTVLRRAGGKTVVTGYDGRISSPILHEALTLGLRQTGCDIICVGIGPTPMVHFASHHLKSDAAIMVTGSHNPSAYNGFKMTLKGKPFYGDAIQALGKQAADADWDLTASGTYKETDIRADYVARLLKDFVPGRALNVVWDSGNGASGDVLKTLIEKLPGMHTVLYADIDGSFPNHHPDPTVDKNLADLQVKMKEVNADLGIAFDGDGDRIGAIDEKSGIIRCDMLLALYASEVLKNQPGATIIGDVKCSGTLFNEVERLGGKALMWKTGHSLVKAKMAETKSPLAGELSGHIFFADKYYGFDDALYCAIRLLNIIGASDKTLSAHLAHLPARLGTPEIRIDVDDDQKFQLVERLKASLTAAFANEGYEMSAIDGIRLNGPKGWLLLRPSNTQACIVARIEAQDQQTLDLLEKRLSQALAKENIQGLPGQNNH